MTKKPLRIVTLLKSALALSIYVCALRGEVDVARWLLGQEEGALLAYTLMVAWIGTIAAFMVYSKI
jgi:hypothetical protein